MKIRRFLLKAFTDKPDGKDIILTIPKEAIFRKVILLDDGIYVYYEVSGTDLGGRIDKFRILGKGESIPAGFEYIDIIEHYVDLPEVKGAEQGKAIIIYPIYKQ